MACDFSHHFLDASEAAGGRVWGTGCGSRMGLGLWVSKPHWDSKSKLSPASGACRAAAWASWTSETCWNQAVPHLMSCLYAFLPWVCTCMHACMCICKCVYLMSEDNLGCQPEKYHPPPLTLLLTWNSQTKQDWLTNKSQGSFCFLLVLGLPSTPSCLSFLFHYYFFNFMHTYVLFVCKYVCECGWPEKPKQGVGSLRTRVADGWKLPCGCWDMNPSLLKEYGVL